ncbi:hypothetical protein L596_010710 [Steinernema carpocapsae]|uniref:RanBP2-type domain-containing protein n=1 Tax=Steinernema carpocapsae TaxID=34508 RepID=A0A4U5PJV3_STECR|nr:hypothetical protein L596_010710 [Steinernema carpocapsae]
MRSSSRWDDDHCDRDRESRGSRSSRYRERSPYSSSSSRRRSRSRSNERDRDRGSRRRRSRSRSAERYRRSPRSRSPLQFSSSTYTRESSSWSSEGSQPTYKIAITVLPPHFERDELAEYIARQGFSPTDIRVVRKPQQGGTKVFAFVDFATVDGAQQWMDYNKGYFELNDGFRAKMEYARENQYTASVAQQAVDRKRAGDWNCAKCTINNFNKRTSCFKCGTSREASEEMDRKGCGMIGTTPCDTLLVRELPSGCSEDSLMQELSQYTTIPILRVSLAESRRYGFLQMRSVEEAGYLLSTFTISAPIIGNCAVIFNYSRQSLNRILLADSVTSMKQQSRVSSTAIAQDGVNAAAQLAQNALQIAQMGKNMDPYANFPTVPTPFGTFPQYSICPQKSTFHFDPNTGYYYDAMTGLYFDSNTEYFFNPQQQSWMFWSVKYMTFIPCEGGDVEVKRQLHEQSRASLGAFQPHQLPQEPPLPPGDPASASTEQQAEETASKPEKAKTAADVQKEMAKWAKRQEKVKLSFSKPSGLEKSQESSSKAWQVDSDDESQSNDAPAPVRPTSQQEEKKPEAFNEAVFIDYSKKSCLLCRRVFNNVETLDKHVQQSDLHKKNLQQKRSEHQQQPVAELRPPPETNAVFVKLQYRDRAKERREQHGLDPGLREEDAISGNGRSLGRSPRGD